MLTVMDVKPPPSKDAPSAFDVVAPPPDTPDTGETQPDAKPTAEKPIDKKPPKVKEPGSGDPNVVAAIIATVLIVFGLAALAAFAYLKQTGSI